MRQTLASVVSMGSTSTPLPHLQGTRRRHPHINLLARLLQWFPLAVMASPLAGWMAGNAVSLYSRGASLTKNGSSPSGKVSTIRTNGSCRAME